MSGLISIEEARQLHASATRDGLLTSTAITHPRQGIYLAKEDARLKAAHGRPQRTESAALEIIDPLNWQDKPIPTRKWVVDGLVPHGSVTMLNGDGGLGKSLLTLQMMLAVATGRQWLGIDAWNCKTLGVYCEDDPEELHRRLADITDGEDLAFGDLENMRLISRVGQGSELLVRDKYGKPQGPSPFYFQVLKEAKAFGAQLIILDGLHDLFDGNENSRPEARQFVNLLRRIALECDGAVVLCAHPSMSGMASGSGSSGSTAWNNAVRSRLYLTRPKPEDKDQEADPDVRVLKSMKSNYGKVGDEIRLRWKEGVFIREGMECQGGALGTVARISAENAFLACMEAVTAQGRHVTDAKNSGRYAPRIFATMPEADGAGKKVLEAAMTALFNKRQIKMDLVRGADRHPVKALVRVP